MSEEGSPSRPRRPSDRVRRITLVSSSSESDGDGSIAPPRSRRKRLRVMSDDGSESSGSSVVVRRRKTLSKLAESSSDSGSSSDHTDELHPSPGNAAKPSSGFASDSSEGNSDKCSICLLRFKDQEVGTPENCEHVFCLDCITEWSKNMNTCPVDRLTFDSIVVRTCLGGRVVRTQPVKVERRSSVDIMVIEDLTSCQICGSTANEESMLLCDSCDLGYHMQCLTPALTEIPSAELWFCPTCEHDHMPFGYGFDLEDLNDLLVDWNPSEPIPSASRRGELPSTSRGRAARPARAPRGSSATTARTPAPRRRTQLATRPRQRRKRKARTIVVEYEVQENEKFPITSYTVTKRLRKRKRRSRAPRTAARRALVRASVRRRLAALLPPANAAAAPAPPLSVFGVRDQLDFFEEEEVEVDAAPGGGAAVAIRPNANVFAAFRQARRKMVSVPSPPHATAAPDLLSSILESQTALHGARGARLDVRRAEATTKQTPMQPGQQPRRGGWGGGYRGTYHCDHGTGGFSRGHEAYPGARPAPPAGPPRPPDGPAAPLAQYSQPRRPSPPPARLRPSTAPLAYRPLPEPPVFGLLTEEGDPGLVIDTEKYDPTEPTHDEDSGSGSEAGGGPIPADASGGAAALVSASVLEGAVRQVLQEHRALLATPPPAAAPALSDGDSDGDCPNFAIYSAASVHIANNTSSCMSEELAPTPRQAEPPHEPEPVPELEPEPEPELPTQTRVAVEVRNKEDEYKAKVSKRCPITTSTRNPIKIKLVTPSLIRRPVSLYEDEAAEVDEEAAVAKSDSELEREPEPESKVLDHPEVENENSIPADCAEQSVNGDAKPDDDDDDDKHDLPLKPLDEPEQELEPEVEVESALDKMTESISETEDERSYTPCLDENKTHSKDTSLDTERDRGLEGLDTELISEEEGNDMFSDGASPAAASPVASAALPPVEDIKKKKKKDSKKEGKEKNKAKNKKSDVTFKKLTKNGKDRNYRERDTDKGKSKKDRRDSTDAKEERRKRKEKRKDLERYDVRTVVGDKRNKVKDAFGRDVSPPRSVSPRRRSGSPRRRSGSPRRRSGSPRRRSISPRRRSTSPRRRSGSPRRRSLSPRRRSVSLRRRSISPRKRSVSPRRRSPSLHNRSLSPSRRSPSPLVRRRSISPRKKSPTPRRKSPARRRRSTSRGRKRGRRSVSKSPEPKPSKKKKRGRSGASPTGAGAAVPAGGGGRRRETRRKSPKRKRAKRPSRSRSRSPSRVASWRAASLDSRLLSPRTPAASPPRRRARRQPPPSKEVFTSGDNILVSVSFQDQERDAVVADRRKRKEAKRDKRRKRRRAAAAAADADAPKPVAIIDLERSPFREVTPSPKNVIVLSDSDHGEKEPPPPALAPPAPEPAEEPRAAAAGPKTPPEPAQVKFSLGAKPPPRAPNPLRDEAEGERPAGPSTPPTPPDSPDAYDPFEPTRSASGSPAPPAPAPEPPRALITLETAQKTNMSADDVIDRRPLSPIEKVMALLQSTRDVSPEPPPGDRDPPPIAAEPPPPAPRVVLPEQPRPSPAKLFLAKPSPIKSNPVKPMQATKISRLPLPMLAPSPGGDSPYSPGSSDFGDLFEPPPSSMGAGKRDVFDALLPGLGPRRRARRKTSKRHGKGNKTQVGVKIDEDNLKIMDELPSSAVEMQVKSKFLKKLNRQERVVEEVKLVLKPHYNKKHVTKEEYKDVLRRAVPKICHNKSGEINPTKIQALVEAYVKKIRKKHKLGLA